MNRLLSGAIVILLCTSMQLSAQETEPGITLYGTAVVPLGTYAATLGSNPGVTRRFGFDIGEKAGLGTPGAGIGVDLRIPVLAPGLGWVVSLQGVMNGVSTRDALRRFQDDVDDSVAIGMSAGLWVHLPLFTGLDYSFGIPGGLRAHVTLQGGIHITRQASRTFTVDGMVVEETTFQFMPDFGYLVGIGISLFGEYELMVRFVDLGTPRYEGTRVLSEKYFTTIPRRENAIQGEARSVRMLQIGVGYTL